MPTLPPNDPSSDPNESKPNGRDITIPDPFDPAALRIDPDGEPGSVEESCSPRCRSASHTSRSSSAATRTRPTGCAWPCSSWEWRRSLRLHTGHRGDGDGGVRAGGDARLPVARRRCVPVARPVAGRRRAAQRLARDRARSGRGPRASGPV